MWANRYARQILMIPKDMPEEELPRRQEFHIAECLVGWDMPRYKELWDRVWRDGPVRQTVVLRGPNLEVETLVQPGLSRRKRRSIHIFMLSTGARASESRRARETLAKLTQREREVAQMVAEGFSTAKIAARLRISPRTVDIHRARIAAKLGGSPSPAQIARLVFLGSATAL